MRTGYPATIRTLIRAESVYQAYPVKSIPILREAQMNSFLPYMGGKSRLTDQIISRMPEHECYVEVFAGAAWLLFRKEESKTEIIKDINSGSADFELFGQ